MESFPKKLDYIFYQIFLMLLYFYKMTKYFELIFNHFNLKFYVMNFF